ncbi:MAG TPA: hypothetical protein DDZ55_09205 [Firmicutes bacterium]|nr:hypothetical protein [Bacillota bacterium]
MIITVCIGSGCHVKGSRKIIAQLQQLIAEENLACDLELEACFCQGRCTEGVVIRVDSEIITDVSTENVEAIIRSRLPNRKKS